jgi:hypothetical protein
LTRGGWGKLPQLKSVEDPSNKIAPEASSANFPAQEDGGPDAERNDRQAGV